MQWCKQNPTYQWDMIIIGGGIVGAGVLREASKQGLNVLLVEQQDFSWGTSSRSSKMVHGGLRYIAQGDVAMTKHSLTEREHLLKEYPDLITRMGYFFLLRKGVFPGRFLMTVLLKIYDWLAGIKDQRFYSSQQVIDTFPGINAKKLNGACYYTDTVVDDSRLVLRVISEAIGYGGKALNYIKAVDLTRSDSGNVTGVLVQNEDGPLTDNQETSQTAIALKASVVINATGAWADKLRMKVVDEKRVRPLRGSHILFSEKTICVPCALTLTHPKDKRGVFIFPWQGTTVVGTTDLDHPENLDVESKITQEEVNYLLELVNFNFPDTPILIDDILSSFAGVRPIIGSDKSKDPSKERRDHAIWADKGLVTVSGGKLTTFKLIARDVLSAAKPWLKESDNNNQIETVHAQSDKADNEISSEKSVKKRFLGKYGANAQVRIDKLIKQSTEKELALIEHTPFCLADCRWALQYEAVNHLDDLLLRRTRLGLLLSKGASYYFADIKVLCQQELHWTEAMWEQELFRYQRIWESNYSVCTTSRNCN
jgi:glycerol-3-phosphate dehydrogenase